MKPLIIDLLQHAKNKKLPYLFLSVHCDAATRIKDIIAAPVKNKSSKGARNKVCDIDTGCKI